VSPSDDEKAQSNAQRRAPSRRPTHASSSSRATASSTDAARIAGRRRTSIKFEVGQVVADRTSRTVDRQGRRAGDRRQRPRGQLATFKASRYKATLTSAPDQSFDVVLRELSPQRPRRPTRHVPLPRLTAG
jgi:hypothetical protein